MVELVEQQPLALLGCLQVGDVEHPASPLDGLAAARLAHHLAAIHHPADLAIGAADAILELIALLRAGEDLLLAQPGAFAVVGMDEGKTRSEGGYRRGLIDSQDL